MIYKVEQSVNAFFLYGFFYLNFYADTFVAQ